MAIYHRLSICQNFYQRVGLILRAKLCQLILTRRVIKHRFLNLLNQAWPCSIGSFRISYGVAWEEKPVQKYSAYEVPRPIHRPTEELKMTSTNSENNSKVFFKGEFDRFRGVTVSSLQEPRTIEELLPTLQNSLSKWREDGVRAVWMKVYLQHSNWIPTLVENGFTYHHTKPSFVTMIKWLPENEPNNLPGYAHNTVGVGAFVINEAEELLVVSERFVGHLHWKLPGGYVELGEDLTAAAMREVKEETGIETEFESLLAFRHMHNLNFGCSDLYFIVRLKPLSHTISMCKNELAGCQWMKLQDFIEHSDVNETNKFYCQCYLKGKGSGASIKVWNHEFKVKNFSRNQSVYYIDTDTNNSFSKQPPSADAEPI